MNPASICVLAARSIASRMEKRVASSIGAFMKWLAIMTIHCMFIHWPDMPCAWMPAASPGGVFAIHGNRNSGFW